jgi:hypothetical protein
MAEGDGVVPGSLEEPDEARIVDVEDRLGAVLGGLLELEAAVADEGGTDRLGAFGDLVRVDLDAHDGLGPDVVPQVERRVHGAHGQRC